MKLFYVATTLLMASFVPTIEAFSMDRLLAIFTGGNAILETPTQPTEAAIDDSSFNPEQHNTSNAS
jgi:hypothetical protein